MALRTANPGVAVKSRRLTDDERADLLVTYYLNRAEGYTVHAAARMVNTSYVTLTKWEQRFGSCLREICGEFYVCHHDTRAVDVPLSEVA